MEGIFPSKFYATRKLYCININLWGCFIVLLKVSHTFLVPNRLFALKITCNADDVLSVAANRSFEGLSVFSPQLL